MRLNRHLSLCGAGSRRGCEQIILEGRVSINGHVVKELATQVGPKDEVSVDGKPVRPAAEVVVAFHKPRGYICSRGDTHDRATIYAILPPQYQSLHYVGRLDKESEGLLLLTNRGELSQRLTHPSEGVEKEYEVTIDKDFVPEHKLKLLHGMLTEEGHAKAERVWVDTSRRIYVVLKQGLKRQIRLMFYQLGYEVERLVRKRIGGLQLKGLPRGAWKELTEAEIQKYFIKHKEREPAPRAAKAKKAEAEEGDDHFASEPAPAPFKVRPGPASSGLRKPRRPAGDAKRKGPFSTGRASRSDAKERRGESDREGPVEARKPKRFTKARELREERSPDAERKPRRNRDEAKFGRPARKSGPFGKTRSSNEDAEPAFEPRYDSDMPRQARVRSSAPKPRRFTKTRELREDRSPADERKPAAQAREGKPRSFGPAKDKPAFAKKASFAKKNPFKAGNKAPRKGRK